MSKSAYASLCYPIPAKWQAGSLTGTFTTCDQRFDDLEQALRRDTFQRQLAFLGVSFERVAAMFQSSPDTAKEFDPFFSSISMESGKGSTNRTQWSIKRMSQEFRDNEDPFGFNVAASLGISNEP